MKSFELNKLVIFGLASVLLSMHAADNTKSGLYIWNHDQNDNNSIHISNRDGVVATITARLIETVDKQGNVIQKTMVDIVIGNKHIAIPIEQFENVLYIEIVLQFKNQSINLSAIGSFFAECYNFLKGSIDYDIHDYTTEDKDSIKNYFNDLVFLLCTYISGNKTIKPVTKAVANAESKLIKHYFHDPELIRVSFALFDFIHPGNSSMTQKLVKASAQFIVTHQDYTQEQKKAISNYLKPYIDNYKYSATHTITPKLSTTATQKEKSRLVIYTITFSPDNQIIAYGLGNGEIHLHDIATQSIEKIYAAHNKDIFSLTFSPDYAMLASGSRDGTIKFWNINPNKLKRTFDVLSPVHSIKFSPNGLILAFGTKKGVIYLYHFATKTFKKLLNNPQDKIIDIAFSPDGTMLASGSKDGTIKLWNLITDEIITILDGHKKQVLSVAFSPDGTMLASGSKDETIKLWDLKTNKLIKTFSSDVVDHGIYTLAFSSDSTMLATPTRTKSKGYSIKLWDIKTGNTIATLIGHRGTILDIAFSPNGTMLASGSADRSLRLWDITLIDLLQTIKQWGKNLME